MASKKHRPEEAVAKLRQVDVLVSQGQTVAEAIRAIGVTEVTYYLYGLLPLRKRSLGWVHRPVCVPVSGVMGLPQRPNGKSARAGLNRWPAYGWPR